ncbi:MAG: ABC transporter permease [Halobacteriota archaeon]
MATEDTLPGAKLRERVNSWVDKNIYAVLLMAFVVLLWMFYSEFINTRGDLYFPSVEFVITQSMANQELLISSLQQTMTETLIGWVIGMTLGIILGTAFSEVSFIKHTFFPTVIFWQSLPMAVLAPMFVVWFGTGLHAVALFAGISSFWVVMISTITGFGTIDKEFDHLGTVFGATYAQQMRRIRVWAALPHIFTGLKVGAQQAIVGAIVAEFVASGSGIGYIVKTSVSKVQPGLMFSSLILIMVFALIFYKGVEFSLDYLSPGPSLE